MRIRPDIRIHTTVASEDFGRETSPAGEESREVVQRPYDVEYFASRNEISREHAADILAKAGGDRDVANRAVEQFKAFGVGAGPAIST